VVYYGIVRYIYNICDRNSAMSQIMINKPASKFLFSDLVFINEAPYLISEAPQVVCFICQKGIQDGYSLSARVIDKDALFFCDKHR